MDASKISNVSGSELGFLVEAFALVAVALTIAFVYSWLLTLAVVVFFPLLAIVGVFQVSVADFAVCINLWMIIRKSIALLDYFSPFILDSWKSWWNHTTFKSNEETSTSMYLSSVIGWGYIYITGLYPILSSISSAMRWKLNSQLWSVNHDK